MTKKEKKPYLNLLLKEKERIFKTLGYLEEGTMGDKKKEGGGVPTHIADLGTDVFERNLGIDLTNSEGKILCAINEAIEKCEKGKYGVCEDCKSKIPISRLRALPYAKFCIKCQKENEKIGEKT